MTDFGGDGAKSIENSVKFGFSHEEAASIFNGSVMANADAREDYGDLLESSFGLFQVLPILTRRALSGSFQRNR